MSIIRLYTGDDGQSHIEEMSPESHPELASLQSTAGIVFRTVDPGYFSDWHNAPRRQFVITVQGEVELVWVTGRCTASARGTQPWPRT